MLRQINRTSLRLSAAMVTGLMLSSAPAHASSGNNFSKISENIAGSIASVPGLLSGLAYMFGILLGVLGILKIKDHVENPSQTPLKDGAIRLAAGGGLFALPIIYEAMLSTVGADGAGVDVAKLSKVELGLE